MTPVTVAADKRFLRAHVRPVRRRTTWRIVFRVVRALAVVALVGYCAWRVGESLVNSTLLSVERVTVRGNERLSKDQVVALMEGLRGQNILRADLDAARRRLLASPWVADAVLRKRLPASVDVLIRERRPMGIARLPGGRLYLIDDEGTEIDEFGPKYAEFDLPIVDGLAVPGSQAIDPHRAELAARLLASVGERPDLCRRISQIDVSDANDAVVLLDTDSALLRLGDRDFRQRLEGYVDLAPALRERVATIDYVDLRYGNHVFVGTGASRGARGTAGRE